MSLLWTKKEIEILKIMAEAGKSVDEVLTVLKSRTDSAVLGKAERLGITFTPKPEFDEAAFKKIMGMK